MVQSFLVFDLEKYNVDSFVKVELRNIYGELVLGYFDKYR